MFKFDNDLFKNKILIVSDVDEDPTHVEANEIEKKYIETKISQMEEYGADVDYAEVLNEKELKDLLSKYNNKQTIIFNWCERLDYTEGTECDIAKIYEDMGFTYTGADLEHLKLVADKFRVKEILAKNNILVPKHYFVSKDNIESLDIDFSKKYIVKSNNIHASLGIYSDNVVKNKKEYLAVSKRLVIELDTDIIVEEFIKGSEYTVVVWGNENPIALPIIKVAYADNSGNEIMTSDAKFGELNIAYIESPLQLMDPNENPELFKKISKIAVDVYKALGLMDYARFDFRVAANGIYAIDANANPYINTLDESEVYMSSKVFGYNYGETILQICEFAFLRNKKAFLNSR